MNRRLMTVKILSVGLGLFTLILGSPAGALGKPVTYQGQLLQNGSPTTGSCDFQFGVFDAPTGGTQLGDTVLADFGTIDGGYANRVVSSGATIDGGAGNDVTGAGATIAGGFDYTTDGDGATIGGGSGNQALSFGTTVAGGESNEVLRERDAEIAALHLRLAAVEAALATRPAAITATSATF